MLPIHSDEPHLARIIVLHPRGAGDATPLPAEDTPLGGLPDEQLSASTAPARQREDSARHFLKFMLPGIPIAAFVVSFLFGYLLLGIHSTAQMGHSERETYSPVVDPTLPLLGALLLSFMVGMLCVTIYMGYVRISEDAQTQR